MRRLRARPTWRGASDSELVGRMVALNAWLKADSEAAAPPMQLLDTTKLTVDETVALVADWARARLSEAADPRRRV